MTAGKKISIDLGGDDMRICPKCKKELADDVKFCTGCGYKLDETVSDAHKTSDTHLNEDKNYSKWVFVIGICVFIVVAACFYFRICLKQDTGQEIMEQEQEQEQKTADNLTEEDIFLLTADCNGEYTMIKKGGSNGKN